MIRFFVVFVRKAFTFQKESIIKYDNLITLDMNAIKIVHNLIKAYNIHMCMNIHVK